ncbi:hypothetical protein H6F78_16710 [Coleofasciculus sp. FACHB-64]|uniref:hypothetical protein n=1 Tax=Cyanophyceae TaxID=3028117 RepID=UPI001683C719|nr:MULTISPECIES: hypothetical protein [unclassified Coleofasciculus]MBD1837562.1 hypothetical protein [Coleofasciculus sp. FACHB-501]MBD2047215.1 hypothetical protein [Coleofasciculus sp. FACHB-64]
MTQGREDVTQSATVVFCDAQQRCLTELAPTLNGRTPKQHNPFPPLTLAWASWLIARLGGWSGYQSQRVPGIVTLFQGLRQIDSLFLGWSLASCPDVYTR